MPVHPNNIEAGKLFSLRHGFKVCTGALYLGGYIGDDESKRECLKERTKIYEWNIFTIRETAGKYPKESYFAMVHAIQPAWIFLQHITTNTGDAFEGVEKMIGETFLHRILFRKIKYISPILGALSTMQVKKY